MRLSRGYKGVDVHLADGVQAGVRWSLGNLTLPRLTVLLLPDGSRVHDDQMYVAVELSDDGSDPFLEVSVQFPWRRPRPWVCEVEVPPKRWRAHDAWLGQRFKWRRPGVPS